MVNHCSKFITSVALATILTGCQAEILSFGNWKTYHNPRYGFEFPYPGDWLSCPIPSNLDGLAFHSPEHPSIEIRGWARKSSTNIAPINQGFAERQQKRNKSPGYNFTTEQGLTGKIRVNIGLDISSITLTLVKDKLQYNLEGKANSQEFANYYRFFHYVAKNYRIPQ